MNPRVRKFRIDDTEGLIELFRNTIRHVNRRDYTDEQVTAWAREDIDAAKWTEEFSSRITLVLEAPLSGMIVGFTDMEPSGHIDRFFVHHDMQREGLGSMLVDALEFEARRVNLERIFLEASITAKPFFTRKGFVLLNENRIVHRGIN